MLRIVISNQRGGVAKTTTAVTLARSFADSGKKVLLVDTDSQGSVSTILGLKPELFLSDFLVGNMAFRECIVQPHERIDVMCSNRKTTEAEVLLSSNPFREMAFERLFTPHEDNYDVVLIDVAPSITLSQQCAMVYARQVLVPVGMETLSLQGALAAVNSSQALNTFFKQLDVRTIGLLPVMVNRRMAMTDLILNSLEQMAKDSNIALLPAIRTDTAVPKAARLRQFLADYDPRSKALEDYSAVAAFLAREFDSADVRTAAKA